MVSCMCVIQEGQTPDRRREALATALDGYVQERLGASPSVSWVPVAEGNGFTAGKPSTSSVLVLTAEEPLTQQHRESVLRELVALWTSETGCSVDEIVAVVADPASH
ncbi:MAG: hypothetical protein AAGE43_08245 [Pseudomonadota bacterium]